MRACGTRRYRRAGRQRATRSWLVLRSCPAFTGSSSGHDPQTRPFRGEGARVEDDGPAGIQAPERRRSAWPRARPGATSCAAWQRRPTGASAGPSSRNGRPGMPFLVVLASRDSAPEPRDAALPGPSTRRAARSWRLPRVLAQAMGMEGRPRGPQCRAPWAWKAKSSVKSAKGVTVAVLSGRGWDARHARPKRGADKGTLLAGNGFLLTGGGQMSPARLLRLAGLVSVAARGRADGSTR